MRLLFVPPRFADATVGGAERLVRALATRAIPEGWSAEVATTCARTTTRGRTSCRRARARRTACACADSRSGRGTRLATTRCTRRVLSGGAAYVEELEWLATASGRRSCRSSSRSMPRDYDLSCSAPTSSARRSGARRSRPSAARSMPCLHDEPYACLRTVRARRRACAAASSTPRPRSGSPSASTGPRTAASSGWASTRPRGRRPPASPSPRGPRAGTSSTRAASRRASASTSRSTTSRGTPPSAPTRRSSAHRSRPVPAARGAVERAVYAGFVAEDERQRRVRRGARARQPVAHGEPLARAARGVARGHARARSGGSEVLREHAARSGGGLAFDSYEGFRDALDALLGRAGLRERLGDAGRAYVLEEYGWPAVRARFQDVVEASPRESRPPGAPGRRAGRRRHGPGLRWPALLDGWGHPGEIVAEHVHPRLAGRVRALDDGGAALLAEGAVVLRYSIWSATSTPRSGPGPARPRLPQRHARSTCCARQPVRGRPVRPGPRRARPLRGRPSVWSPTRSFNAADLSRRGSGRDRRAAPARPTRHIAERRPASAEPVVLSVGRIAPSKRIEDVVSAFALYQRHRARRRAS